MKGLFIGLTVLDCVYSLPDYPGEDSKNMSSRYLLDIGGPATNAACTFAALGGEATLISGIGKNAFSGFMQEALKKHSIKHFDLFGNHNAEPVIASVWVNQSNGSRTITSTNANLSPKLVLSTEEIQTSEFDIICIDGFYDEFVLQLLSIKPAYIPVVLDGGSWKTNTEALLAKVTYPIFSSHFQPPDGIGIEKYMTDHDYFPYAITHGEHPIEMVTKQGSYQMDVPPIKAVDTLGAGDVFHGAFAYYINKMSGNFKDALIESARIATFSCQYFGAKTWIEHL